MSLRLFRDRRLQRTGHSSRVHGIAPPSLWQLLTILSARIKSLRPEYLFAATGVPAKGHGAISDLVNGCTRRDSCSISSSVIAIQRGRAFFGRLTSASARDGQSECE